MDFFKDILTKNKTFIENSAHLRQNLEQESDHFMQQTDLFLQTGNIEYLKLASNGGKENVEPAPTTKRRGRTKKPPSASTDHADNLDMAYVSIKKEKISDIQKLSEALDTNIQIKKEAGEMLAPTKLPPRKRKIKTEQTDLPKRSTRSRTMKVDVDGTISSNTETVVPSKLSDVIIENSVIPIIEISDNERERDSDNEKTNARSMRTTRSKTRHQYKKTVVENTSQVLTINKITDDVITQSTRNATYTASKHIEDDNKSAGVSTLNSTVVVENPKISTLNSTVVVENTKISTLNSTVVVENPKIIIKETKQTGNNKQDILEEIPKTPPSSKKIVKQIFSPFSNTPLKKKIEAFERLGESSNIPVKSTGTKKKVQSSQNKKVYDEDKKEIKTMDEKGKKSYEKDRFHKTITPVASKFFPKGSSTSKVSKLHPACVSDISTSNDNILSVKSASALKASQAEFREREKRRQEKENEALKKREALLQAQTEEKRRRREEKQQKVQHKREILGKEKQKLLEAQKIKEEKFKQAMVDKEDKLQKQKEDAEKRRLMAKQKANELLKERELMRVAEEKKYVEMKQEDMSNMALNQKLERAHQLSTPIYLTTKPPLLPTNDCYDSDDPEYETRRKVVLPWCRARELNAIQMIMITAGETIKNTFFCRQAQTPDLREIFELIDPKKLKRTSSAIWRKPPRYTLMPTLEDTIEYSEESD